MLIAPKVAVVPDHINSADNASIVNTKVLVLDDDVLGISNATWGNLLASNMVTTGIYYGNISPLFTGYPDAQCNEVESNLYLTQLMHYFFGVRSRRAVYADIPEISVISVSTARRVFRDELLAQAASVTEWNASTKVFILNALIAKVINVSELDVPNKENLSTLALVDIKGALSKANSVLDIARIAHALNRQANLDTDARATTPLPRTGRKFTLKARERKFILRAFDDRLKVQKLDLALSDAHKFAPLFRSLARSLHVSPKNASFEFFDKLHKSQSVNLIAVENVTRGKISDKALAAMSAGTYARNFLHLYDTGSTDIDTLDSVNSQVGKKILWAIRTAVATASIDRLINSTTGAGFDRIAARGEYSSDFVNDLDAALAPALIDTELDGLKVFVDPALVGRVIPQGDRGFDAGSASRGDTIDLSAYPSIRAFTMWEETDDGGRSDLDLSSAVFTEKGDVIRVGWNSQYTSTGITFSGDLTSAPAGEGAAEYITIDLDTLQQNVPTGRFLIIDIYRFSGPSFSELAQATAGIMATPENGDDQATKVYAPENILMGINLKSVNARTSIVPLVIDLKTRQATILGMEGNRFGNGHSSATDDEVSLLDVLKLSEERRSVSPDLHDIATHMAANATLVGDPGEADIVLNRAEVLSRL